MPGPGALVYLVCRLDHRTLTGYLQANARCGFSMTNEIVGNLADSLRVAGPELSQHTKIVFGRF